MLLLVTSLLSGCFVDGKDIVGPGQPDFAAMCVDSTLTDTTRICWAPQDSAQIHIEVTIHTYPFPGS